MITEGVRILDKKNRVVKVKLFDILAEIKNGFLFQWAILDLQASGKLGNGKSIIDFEQEIFNSENGYSISWVDLNLLSHKFNEIIDILIIGCKDKNLLQRYESSIVLYETCDIVIEMVDSGYWEVFSKDHDLIKRLVVKFQDTKFLEPDFEK